MIRKKMGGTSHKQANSNVDVSLILLRLLLCGSSRQIDGVEAQGLLIRAQMKFFWQVDVS
ncbi:hypothetical protein J2T17_003142 [Paenibacillus mucilaginosus]|uniref:hypothetical protein n=1 Tax=Paenibacillus mucilaginosus TaxID=61624 RepID=UPI003D23EBCB